MPQTAAAWWEEREGGSPIKATGPRTDRKCRDEDTSRKRLLEQPSPEKKTVSSKKQRKPSPKERPPGTKKTKKTGDAALRAQLTEALKLVAVTQGKLEALRQEATHWRDERDFLKGVTEQDSLFQAEHLAARELVIKELLSSDWRRFLFPIKQTLNRRYKTGERTLEVVDLPFSLQSFIELKDENIAEFAFNHTDRKRLVLVGTPADKICNFKAQTSIASVVFSAKSTWVSEPRALPFA